MGCPTSHGVSTAPWSVRTRQKGRGGIHGVTIAPVVA